MARSQLPPPKPYTPSVFVDPNLSESEKKELKATPFTITDFDNFLARLFETDYKVTLSVDKKNGTYAAWLIPQGEKHLNAGMLLSGRGSTPHKAIKQALFKHYRMFDGGFWGAGGALGPDAMDD